MSGQNSEGGVRPGLGASADAVQAGGLNPADAASVLRAAADLIEPKGRWTQGAGARGASGEPVTAMGGADSDLAVCWCAWAAMWRANGSIYGPRLRSAERFLRKVTGCDFIDDWNDAPERTQAEVVEALRKAAALADTAQSPSTTDAGSALGMDQ